MDGRWKKKNGRALGLIKRAIEEVDARLSDVADGGATEEDARLPHSGGNSSGCWTT